MTKIDEAKNQIVSAKNRLFRAYIEQVAIQYETSNESRRERILSGLDLIVGGDFELNVVSKRGPKSKDSPFDVKEAIKTRVNEKLTRPEVAKILRPDRVDYMSALIYQFEEGLRTPRSTTKGEHTRNYLLWLKEKGYNPYNL